MSLKKLREMKKNKKGFTLIEIIVVVVILAVLMAIAVPAVMKYINEADDAKYMAQARGAFIIAEAESAKEWMSAKGTKPTEWTSSDTTKVLAELQTDPAVKKVTATINANGNVTQVVVEFESKKATVTPNDKVVIADKTN